MNIMSFSLFKVGAKSVFPKFLIFSSLHITYSELLRFCGTANWIRSLSIMRVSQSTWAPLRCLCGYLDALWVTIIPALYRVGSAGVPRSLVQCHGDRMYMICSHFEKLYENPFYILAAIYFLSIFFFTLGSSQFSYNSITINIEFQKDFSAFTDFQS